MQYIVLAITLFFNNPLAVHTVQLVKNYFSCENIPFLDWLVSSEIKYHGGQFSYFVQMVYEETR